MGAGHYHIRDGVTVYAEPYEGFPEFDESIRYMWEDAYSELQGAITGALSRSFWKTGRDEWRDDAVTLARSKLHDVTLHESSHGYCYVTVRPRADLDCRLDALAAGNIDAVAARLFGKLAADYDLLRGSGWSSVKYEPKA